MLDQMVALNQDKSLDSALRETALSQALPQARPLSNQEVSTR
jgi:hypothetical protein